MRMIRLLLVLTLSVLFAQSAAAHRANESYVYFQVSDTELTGRFEATLNDLGKVLDLDSDGNGTVDEAEARAKEADILEYLSPRLTLRDAGAPLTLTATGLDFLDAGAIGNFMQVKFKVDGLSAVPDTLDVHYAPMLDINPQHFGYILIESNTRVGLQDNEAYVSLVFTGGAASQSLSLVGEPWGKVFGEFVQHGMWQLWLGFEHVAFLVAVLLASVMAAAGARWHPLESFSAGLWNAAKIVAVFAIAHSITLMLAAFKLVTLPMAFVQTMIAASLIVAAVMNVIPSLYRYVLWVVFGFGLFHGFGLANALAPLALDPTRQVAGVLGFNLGVELGQLAIVFMVFPVLWAIRDLAFYPFTAFRMGTVVLVLIGAMWFVERGLGVEINMRAAIAQLTGVQL